VKANLRAVTDMLMRDESSRAPSRVGILLLNSSARPVHYNAEAVSILGYPEKRRNVPSLQAVLTPLQLAGLGRTNAPTVVEFVSGRRRYLCRAFHLDGHNGGDHRTQRPLVLVLERESRQSAPDTAKWCEQFQLTTRECETVKFLLKGLTSKEIATEMSISPNTVKAFLRMAMAKVGATNRTALIARIFELASLITIALRV
jgi:DNA-binding CsgD family transcriptional regulator